ncbi:hypothetical protein H5410_046439 [Solanum commersonii]|uniref:Uncharacterized protein n=1 Tax=Solanum commersonii TaxID=4109 RepID=A0A9J5XEC0_SOLCO|nr:hypothetical protein H5410_046439 [Solanum commersonii]
MKKNKLIFSMMMVIVMETKMMVAMTELMMMAVVTEMVIECEIRLTLSLQDKFHMKQKRKKSVQELLASLRGQQAENISENFEFDYAVGIKWVTHSLRDRWRACKYKLRCDHFYPNKCKEEILFNRPTNVDSNDWTTFVHHYKEDKMKIQSAQNTRNRTKLRVSHAGGSKRIARKGRQMDKILEHLPEDQEHIATLRVPLKILAHPNDAMGKVYGVEHYGRVRGIGGNVCPSAACGMPRYSISHVNVDTSNNMSHQRVEDLEKHVETLEEKLTRYEETKEKLNETKEKLEETNK